MKYKCSEDIEGENYNRLIREADAALYNKDYSKARPLYVEAHQLIPEELYAAQKVAEIDLLLAGNKSDEALDEKIRKERGEERRGSRMLFDLKRR